jgi:Raf kinase inhibitor-like YbhB/YbcL family protein
MPEVLKMKTLTTKVLAGLVVVALTTAIAQAAEGGGPPTLATKLAPARGGGKLRVTSPAFAVGDAIPDRFTQNGDNMSPSIEWTKGPTGTRSYVVLAEDAGVNRQEPIVHWVMYDINPAITRLPQGMPTDGKVDDGVQGKNIAGKTGYVGPKPPAGQTHPYHFEVFALNTKLNLEPNADRDAVVAAMKGKVLASGDLVGNYTGK